MAYQNIPGTLLPALIAEARKRDRLRSIRTAVLAAGCVETAKLKSLAHVTPAVPPNELPRKLLHISPGLLAFGLPLVETMQKVGVTPIRPG